MKQLLMGSLLLFVSCWATAATYNVTGGNWESWASWNTSASGQGGTDMYDNADSAPSVVLGGLPGGGDWTPAMPTYDGSYSGTLVTDGSGVVTGGILTVSGTIGWQIFGGPYSWWAHSYDDLILNFNAMTASVTSYTCHDSGQAPVTCAGGGAVPESILFGLTSGNEGVGGAARDAANFDGTTLTLFSEGYSIGAGSDYETAFALTVTAVPIPSAVWLFGSALLGLGWLRRKQCALGGS